MRSLCLVAILALTACSWDPDASDINVTVNNIAQSTTANVNHLDVTLTLADGPHVFHPTFGPQSGGTIVLALSSNGQGGTATVKVEQFDRNATSFGSATSPATPLTPPSTNITVTLPTPLLP